MKEYILNFSRSGTSIYYFMSTPQLPNELWLHVFEDNAGVTLHSRDFAAIVLCSRLFHQLATKSLYRSVIWTNPLHFHNSLPIWRRISDPPIAEYPQSLVISISKMDVPVLKVAEVINLDGSVSTVVEAPDPSLHLYGGWSRFGVSFSNATRVQTRIPMFAASSLHSTMINLMQSFSNLNALTFKAMLLPGNFQALVYQFPRLRMLHIEACDLCPSTDDSEDIPSNNSLIIEELHVLDLFYRFPFPSDKVDALASCPSLVTLHVDPSSHLFIPKPHTGRFPPNLKRLYVHALNGKPEQVEVRDLMQACAWIIHSCPMVKFIDTAFAFPEDNDFFDIASPPIHFYNYNLPHYGGPLQSFNALPFTHGLKSLLSLHIHNENMTYQVCSQIAQHLPNLQVLSIVVNAKSDIRGVLYGTAYLTQLKGLVRLKIVFLAKPGDLHEVRFVLSYPSAQ
jgi:hypothetical protein